jgi:DNA polymerase
VALADGKLHVWVPWGRGPAGGLGTLTEPDLRPEGFDYVPPIDFYCGMVVPEIFLQWCRDGYTFCAHNAFGFDAPALERLLPELRIPAWYDTLPCARAAGLPGSLDALGNVFLGRGKDAGKDALKLLYTAKEVKGEYVYNRGTVPLWRAMLRYNVADVLLLERVFTEVFPYGEGDVLSVDHTINQRGIAFDPELIRQLLSLWHLMESSAIEEVERLTDGVLHGGNLRSQQAVRRWLESQGLTLRSLNRQGLELLYESPEEYFEGVDSEVAARVIEVLKARQRVSRTGSAKLERIYDIGSEGGRVRNTLVYHGAQPGRWTGRGIQPHNFPRGVNGLDVQNLLTAPLTKERITAEAVRLNAQVDDVLSTLVRPVFLASPGKTLLILDYGAVEARGVAWVAGEQRLLDIFADPSQDVYLDMASRIFGRECTKADKDQRHIGKTAVLGCGYSMGAEKFGLYCKSNRIDLAAAGTSAEQAVEAYRDAYPAIAGAKDSETGYRRGGVWRSYHRAAHLAVEKRGRFHTNKCVFDGTTRHLRIALPSGRVIVYRNVTIRDEVPRYSKILGVPCKPKPTLFYAHPHGFEKTLYGGLITENIVQGICRDLLATALVRFEAAGIPVVLHVHDEIVCEVDAADKLNEAAEIMSDPPEWAEGFPVIVEGFASPRYVKVAYAGYPKVRAMGGKVL